jgi:Bacterial Ig-like domain (group 3)
MSFELEEHAVNRRMKTLVVAIAGWLIVGMLSGMPSAEAATSTTVNVSSSANPSTAGDTVTFTAVVRAADGSTPTGAVTFNDNYEVYATRSLSGGVATYSAALLYSGSRTLTVSYSGDGTHAQGSGSLPLIVRSTTTTSLSSTLSTSTLGQEVTFIAKVYGGYPGGPVTFTDGSETLAVVPVVNNQATYTMTSLQAGSHAIAASYAGDASTAPSSATLTQNVLSSAAFTLVSSLNPAVAGQSSVTWRATVAAVPGRPTPTGAVTFNDNYEAYATRSLDGSGTASYSMTPLYSGNRTLTATYSGDANYAASSTTLAQRVLTATSVSLTSTGSPTDPGRQVTFTASVSGAAPTGTVTFADGSQTLAVVPLASSKATFSSTTLSPGAHVISASYSGDQQNGPSSATKSHAVNVPTGGGYWMLGTGGEVFAFGGAADLGGADDDAADIEPTPSGKGYWILGLDGSVTAKGDATYLGRAWAGYDEFAASISATPDGQGYWVFTSAGRAIPFGNADFFGDMEGTRLNGSVLDSVVTKSGHGYWMVGSDGGIFAFGDAKFFGSTGNLRLNMPVMSMVADPDGAGYWLVASDGGIFAFDAPFYGSMGNTRLNKPVSAMVGGPAGYLMVGQDGGIFAFGASAFYGSLGARPPANPIIAVGLKPANT